MGSSVSELLHFGPTDILEDRTFVVKMTWCIAHAQLARLRFCCFVITLPSLNPRPSSSLVIVIGGPGMLRTTIEPV